MKYKTLVVGCGAISNVWFSGLKNITDCEIAALVDINIETARAKRDTFALDCPVYDNFESAIIEIVPDVVCDLTYVACHRDVTIRALRFGAHVFGEKPMSISREDSQAMLSAARENGKVYNVLQNRRYSSGIRGLRTAVNSGLLGPIWMTCCEIYVNADLGGARNTLEYPMLQDQAIHSFDSARFILGADAKTVFAHSYNPVGSPYRGDGSGACIYEMTDNSTLVYNAVMGTNWLKTSWHSQWRVIGQYGTAMWNGFDKYATAEILKDGNVERVILEPDIAINDDDWHTYAIAEMFSDLAAGKTCSLNCFDNYGSVAMEYSAIDSIKSGQKVAVK
jgi:Predicted dehydrogenases and related proteins